jgi:predicted dehydrogenase
VGIALSRSTYAVSERPFPSQRLRRLRGAIVGFGVAGESHLAGYATRDDVAIVAIVDPSSERRALAHALLPSTSVYATLDELADVARPDFLDICSPPRWHAEEIVTGLELGCHVMCEKPVVVGVDDFEPIVTALEVSAGVLFPAHNYKYAPLIRRMRDVVASDGFGDVLAAHFRTLRTRHAAGAPEWHPDWRRDVAVAGGGILQDHGPHAAYLAGYLTGLAPAWTACTLTGAGVSSDCAEDTATLTIGMQGGADVRIELTWEAGSRETSYSITGANESVRLDDTQFVHERSGTSVAAFTPAPFDGRSRTSWFGEMFEDFRSLIENPERQGSFLGETYLTISVVEWAYASAACGGARVNLRPVSGCRSTTATVGSWT